MGDRHRNIPRERINQVFRRLIGMAGKNARRWGNYLDRSEAAVRSWRDGGAIPLDWRDVLRLMGVDPDWLDLPDEHWEKWFATLPRGIIPPPQDERPGWLYLPTNLLSATRLIERGSTVIVALNCQEHTAVADVMSSAKVNLERGIPHIFIIPKHSRLKHDLLRLAAMPGVPLGSLRILTVADNDALWQWFEQLILVVSPQFHVAKDAFERMEIGDIHTGFEQLYKGGDILPPNDLKPANGHPWWIGLPPRKIGLSLQLMRQWAASAEWT
jgi:hypothetical protein